jgi:hypothetical protein
MLFGADIIRDIGESLNHICESKIRHVKVDEGGFTVYISGIAKYDRGIVSQGLWYDNWHENILEISSLVDAHQTGHLVWKPATLKRAIDSNSCILFQHLGVVGFHHAAAAATGEHRHGVSMMHRSFKLLINIVKTIIFCSFSNIDLLHSMLADLCMWRHGGGHHVCRKQSQPPWSGYVFVI